MRKGLDTIRVLPLAGGRRGRLVAGGASFPCVLGRGGVRAMKREGDGATPRARLKLRPGFQRLDRGPRLRSAVPLRLARPDEAWCDDASDRRYNRLIRVGGAHEERLRRADALYDVVVPLGWNDGPVRRGRGSAIFWHLMRESGAPTAGCVAVRAEVFAKVLPRLSRRAVMVIG